jgi:hypothetical protein
MAQPSLRGRVAGCWAAAAVESNKLKENEISSKRTETAFLTGSLRKKILTDHLL